MLRVQRAGSAKPKWECGSGGQIRRLSYLYWYRIIRNDPPGPDCISPYPSTSIFRAINFNTPRLSSCGEKIENPFFLLLTVNMDTGGHILQIWRECVLVNSRSMPSLFSCGTFLQSALSSVVRFMCCLLFPLLFTISGESSLTLDYGDNAVIASPRLRTDFPNVGLPVLS